MRQCSGSGSFICSAKIKPELVCVCVCVYVYVCVCVSVCLSQGGVEFVKVSTCLAACTFGLSWKLFWILTVYECDRALASGVYCVGTYFSLQGSLALAREKFLFGEPELGQNSAQGSAGLGWGGREGDSRGGCWPLLSSPPAVSCCFLLPGEAGPHLSKGLLIMIPFLESLPELTFLLLSDCPQLHLQKAFPASTDLHLFPTLLRFVPRPLTRDGHPCLVWYLFFPQSLPLPEDS